MPLPTIQRLHELFEVRGGELYYRIDHRRGRAGALAGYKRKDGYRSRSASRHCDFELAELIASEARRRLFGAFAPVLS